MGSGTKILIIIVLAVVLIAPSSFPNSFALEGYYEPAVREINQQPTVCIFEPDDYRVDEKTWQRWLSDAKAAIAEWESILKQRSTTAHAKWNIEVVEIPKEKQFLYNPSGCDIEVYYTGYVSEELLGALGWYWVGKGIIEIVFLQTDFCGRISIYGFYLDYYCYGDNLERPKKMAAVLQHELGHAFGLGHYLPYTQEQLDGWQEHPLGQPSIMTIAHHNEEQMQIQKLDIDKIFEVYSAMGFGRTKNENPVFIEIEPEEPELDFDFSGNVQQVIVERGKIVTHKISGYVPEFLYSRGMPVEFQMEFPDSSVHESAIVVTGHKYYEVPLPFSWESQRGEYKIIVRYDGMEIQTAIINVGTESSIIPKQPTFSPESEDKGLEIRTRIERAKWYQKIDDLKQQVIQTTGSLRGLVFVDKLAQQKIDNAWESNYYLQQSLNDVERKYGAGDYELEKGDFITALEMFEAIGHDLQTANTLYEMMLKDISEAKEIGSSIPSWIRSNAQWWADGITSDEEFVTSIQYMIENKIIRISDLPSSSGETQNEIPDWLRQNVKWWAEGQVSDGEFVSGIKWFIEKGIIRVS